MKLTVPEPTLPARSGAVMTALAKPSWVASIGPTHEYEQVRNALSGPLAGKVPIGSTGKPAGIQLVATSGPDVTPPARLIVTVGAWPKPEVASIAMTST